MARFTTAGSVWQIELSHEEVDTIATDTGAAAGIAAAAGGPLGEAIGLLLGAIAGVLVTVDGIGGHNGVNVVGVLGTQFVTVTPAFVSPVGLVKTIADALVHETGLPGGVVGAGFGAGVALLAVGPAGVVIGGVAGALGAEVFGNDGPNAGDVHADRRTVGPWEKFSLVVNGDPAAGHTLGKRRRPKPVPVSVSSWRGYFSAENGGGGPVHANRREIGPWEKAVLIRNTNGTVSLGMPGGHFFVAEGGGGDGSVCIWNRTAIGPWEQFWMEFQQEPQGTFALKTFSQGIYVSVQ